MRHGFGDEFGSYIGSWTICCECLPTAHFSPHRSDFGDISPLHPLSCTSSSCNLLFFSFSRLKKRRLDDELSAYFHMFHRCLQLMGPLPTCMHPLPLLLRIPNCGLTSVPRTAHHTFKVCDKQMVNGAFKSSLEESYAEWVEDNSMREKKKKRGPVPVPSRVPSNTFLCLHAFENVDGG